MDYPFIYGAQYYRAPTPDRKFWADDLKRMADSGFNSVKLWAQWRWTHRAPDRFFFDDLDELMDLAVENELMVTINVLFDVAPSWIFNTYPDCKMVTSAGYIVEPQAANCRQIGGYPGPCYNYAESKIAREEFLRKTVERYADHPAMSMWDIWNEPESDYLYRDPKPDTLLCYCDRCHKEFIIWLQKRYHSIDSLNSIWGRCYNDWNEIELPRGQSVFTDMVDWRLFNCHVLAKEAEWRILTAKSIDAIHPVYLHPVPNTLTIFNPITGVDDFRMAEHCDCFAGTTNGIPTAALQTISAGQGRICYNVESHLRYGSTGMYPKKLSVKDFANCFVPQIGLGVRGFLHWQYRCEILGGESPAWGLLDIDGSAGDTHKGASEFWQKIKPFAQKLISAPSEPSQAIIFKSTANEIFHWCMDGTLAPLADDIEGYTRLLYNSNIRLAYADDEIVRCGLPDTVKLLILPDCYAMYQDTADAIVNWVKNGGTLVCEAHTGAYDLTLGRHNMTLPGMGMADRFGLREINATSAAHLGISNDPSMIVGLSDDVKKAISAFGSLGGLAIPLINDSDDIFWGWSRYAEIEGDGLRHIASLPNKNACVGYKKVGEGAVYYIGTLAGKLWQQTGSPGFEKLIRSALDSSGITASMESMSWVPAGVRADVLKTDDGTAYAIYNCGKETSEISIPADESYVSIYTASKTVPGAICIKLDHGVADIVIPARWLM